MWTYLSSVLAQYNHDEIRFIFWNNGFQHFLFNICHTEGEHWIIWGNLPLICLLLLLLLVEKTFWLLKGILVQMKVFLWRLQHMASHLIYVSCTRNKEEREEKARKLSQVSHYSLSISRPSSVWHTQHVGVRTSSTRTYKRKGGGIKTIGAHLSECKLSLECKYTIQD